MRKGALSRYVEQVARAPLFHRAVQDIKPRNADTDPDQLGKPIDGTGMTVRAERRARRRAR